MPTHAELDFWSKCDGTIKPRWRLYKGRWVKRPAWECSACHQHYFRMPDGSWYAGMNREPQIQEKTHV